MAPIHQAARKNDVVALQRELDAGVSPDLRENDFSGTYRPLADVIVFGSAVRPPETIHRRLACIEALLRAIGALDDLRTGGFRAYEKAHRQRLTAIFLPKFQSLPAEIVSHIVSFGFNCGCYEFDAVEPVAHRTRSKGG